MQTARFLLCLAASIACASDALALDATLPVAPAAKPIGHAGSLLPGMGRGTLGLNPARGRANVPCGVTAFGCDLGDNSVSLYAVPLLGQFWGVELGYVDTGNVSRRGLSKTQGLNASLVGKAPIASSWGVFGRVGTTYGRTESLQTAGAERGFGLSLGAGVSYEITPRLSATLAWDSRDFRFTGSGRDALRSTSLGMQYRY